MRYDLKPSEWVPHTKRKPKRATGDEFRKLVESHGLFGKEAVALVSFYLNCSPSTVPQFYCNGLRRNDYELLELRLIEYKVQKIIDSRHGEIHTDGKRHHYDPAQLAAARSRELALKRTYTAAKRAADPQYGRKKKQADAS